MKINGAQRYLWRAVDQHGNVLDVLVQSRRNAWAAKKFFRKLLKGLRYVPRVIVTDKLASYQVAHRELVASVAHRRSRYLNNRAENSHAPTCTESATPPTTLAVSGEACLDERLSHRGGRDGRLGPVDAGGRAPSLDRRRRGREADHHDGICSPWRRGALSP